MQSASHSEAVYSQAQPGSSSSAGTPTNASSQADDAVDAEAASLALEERRKILRARKLMYAYNNYPPPTYTKGFKVADFFGPDERLSILGELFDISLEQAKLLAIEPPLYLDYGTNIEFKGEFYANYGLTVLDCAKVTFGERVLCAPAVQVYAATHSVDVAERKAGLERAYPVSVGDDCWIGGGAILIGPCTIGKNCTVAAGAVVRGDFPDNVVIGGTPARILKHLEPEA